MAWQRRWWIDACKPDRDLICLSMARGGGKTAAAAALAACWALTLPGGDVVIVAASFEQAKLLGRDTRSMMMDADGWLWRDSQQRFEGEHKASGTRLRVMGSDPKRAHGLRAALMVGDEPAAWGPRGAEMLSVLLTARGKIPGSRLVLLGTRAGDPSHWWERLLAEPGERSHVTLFAADPDADPGDETAWYAANPSLKHGLPDISQVRSEAADAARDAAYRQRFRALRLNSGVPSEDNAASLLATGVWAALEAPTAASGDFVLGIDLGGSTSLSAAAAYWPGCGRLEAVAAVGSIPSLEDRGRRFGAPHLFADAHAGGHLLMTPGRNANPAALLQHVVTRWGTPVALVADRYRATEMLDLLDVLGLNCELVWRGQGWRDGPDDVRRFQRACHDNEVAPVRSELFDVSIVVSRLAVDTVGNMKLAHRAERPDDLASAAILAVAEGQRRGGAPPTLRFALI